MQVTQNSSGPAYCIMHGPVHAGALPAAAQAKLAAYLAAELAMLAGDADSSSEQTNEPQRENALPGAAAGASPGQNPRTRSARAASAAPPAGCLRLAHHLPAALRLALAASGALWRERSGKAEGVVQGGGGVAGATAAVVMRHLAHVQHVAVLLTDTAPPPAAPAACWENEVQGASREAPAGGFFAVLGALNSARAADAASAGAGSDAAGSKEHALLAAVDDWRERARICQVCRPMSAARWPRSTAHAKTQAVSAQDLGRSHMALLLNIYVLACIMTRRGQGCSMSQEIIIIGHPAGAGGGDPGGAGPPQAAAARWCCSARRTGGST